ncbi:hypothetical protein BX616_007741, partial [Lobosporangium transversale]
QQQHQSMRASISPAPFVEDEHNNAGGAGVNGINTGVGNGALGGVISSVAAMNLSGGGGMPVNATQHQQAMRLQQQQSYPQHQHSIDYTDMQRLPGMQPVCQNSIGSGPNGGMSGVRNNNMYKGNSNQHYHYPTTDANNNNNNSNNANQYSSYVQPDPLQYQLQQPLHPQYQHQPYHVNQQPRLTATYPSEQRDLQQQSQRPSGMTSTTNNNNNNNNNNNTMNTPSYVKPSGLFATAGPLIDSGAIGNSSSAASNRPPAPDQVFARLARQFPTNPRETEKRERIYRWLDQVADAFTFNPDTETPGWIIPVYPDELDHPESPYYLDRITYELDLMAPVGKPFRKAIDINCNNGEWAM